MHRFSNHQAIKSTFNSRSDQVIPIHQIYSTTVPSTPPQCAHVKGLLTSRLFGLLFYRDPDQALELVFAYLFPVVWYKNYCNTAP